MSEEILCKLGHESKKLTYIDKLTNRVIEVECKLNDKINSKELSEFFNKIYRMKLDAGYSHYPSFRENYATGDLIKCFEAILAEEEIINLEELTNMLDKENLQRLNPVSYAIQEFLNMFAITHVNSLTQREHSCIERSNSINSSHNQNMIRANGELIEVDGIVNGTIKSNIQPKIRVRVPQKQYHQIG